MYPNRKTDYYLVILGSVEDSCATWVGPMVDIEEAHTLNEKTGMKGQVTPVSNRFGPLSASKVVTPFDYKNGQ